MIIRTRLIMPKIFYRLIIENVCNHFCIFLVHRKKFLATLSYEINFKIQKETMVMHKSRKTYLDQIWNQNKIIITINSPSHFAQWRSQDFSEVGAHFQRGWLSKLLKGQGKAHKDKRLLQKWESSITQDPVSPIPPSPQLRYCLEHLRSFVIFTPAIVPRLSGASSI